jgi:nucleoside-diphosphate-sugar epimerase
VHTVVLGSSTATANPPFPVAVKNEIDHVADSDEQIARRNYAAAQKSVMERSARAFAERHGQRLSVILPSMLVGPALLPHHLDGHVLRFLVNLLEGRMGWHDAVPAGSMSLSHPADVAALFLATCERQDASGRYFALRDSWSWHDLYAEVGRYVPADGLPRPLAGEPDPPTLYDFTRRDSLGVAMRDIPTIFAETFDWLKTTPWRSRG